MPREGGARKRANRHDPRRGWRVVEGRGRAGGTATGFVGMKEATWFSLQPERVVTLCLPLPLSALEVAS